MTEYGYINENGIMTSKMLEPYSESFRDDDGELKDRVVSIEEQAVMLQASGWKPVDLIDENMMIAEEFYCIIPIPYDTGERISYQYEKTLDRKAIKTKIQALKNELLSDDYKIIKCYEASLVGEPFPYDIEKLRLVRQSIRDEINYLENVLS